jgi:hypothetical protein
LPRSVCVRIGGRCSVESSPELARHGAYSA